MASNTIPSGMEKLVLLGWREWVALPELGLPRIKAKIDTGARTSSLHAEDISVKKLKSGSQVRFYTVSGGGDNDLILCEAMLLDERQVSDSGGHRERRFFIQTILSIKNREWPIELSLTDRNSMRFPMLVGRQAMAHRFMTVPHRSYLTKKSLQFVEIPGRTH